MIVVVGSNVATKVRNKMVGWAYLISSEGWIVKSSRRVRNGIVVLMVLHSDCTVKFHWMSQRILCRMWNKLVWGFALQYLCLLS